MAQRSIPVQKGETSVTVALRTFADIMGWAVTSTTNGAHSKTSHHYSGRAVDLAARSGPGRDTSELLAINEGIVQVLPLSMVSELIYSGPGNVCVKNGRIVDGLAAYGRTVMGRHHDHVHLAVVPNFTYNGSQEVAKPMAVTNNPDLPDIVGPVQLSVLQNQAGECTGYFIFSHATGELHGFGPGARFHGRSEVTKIVET